MKSLMGSPEMRAKLSARTKDHWDSNPERKVTQGAKVSAANLTDGMTRFQSHIIIDADGCHIWQSTKIYGYAKFSKPKNAGQITAIRWLWNELHGPPPAGLQPDHLCHTNDMDCPGGDDCKHRACVNLEHIEWVTPSENLKRMHHRKRLIKARKELPL